VQFPTGGKVAVPAYTVSMPSPQLCRWLHAGDGLISVRVRSRRYSPDGRRFICGPWEPACTTGTASPSLYSDVSSRWVVSI